MFGNNKLIILLCSICIVNTQTHHSPPSFDRYYCCTFIISKQYGINIITNTIIKSRESNILTSGRMESRFVLSINYLVSVQYNTILLRPRPRTE